MNLEAHQSSNKAQAADRRREARLATVEPSEDFMVRFLRAWEGPSNSGVATITGTESAHVNRFEAAVRRAADKHRAEGMAALDLITPEQRKDAAAIYRQQAAELERGT